MDAPIPERFFVEKSFPRRGGGVLKFADTPLATDIRVILMFLFVASTQHRVPERFWDVVNRFLNDGNNLYRDSDLKLLQEVDADIGGELYLEGLEGLSEWPTGVDRADNPDASKAQRQKALTEAALSYAITSGKSPETLKGLLHTATQAGIIQWNLLQAGKPKTPKGKASAKRPKSQPSQSYLSPPPAPAELAKPIEWDRILAGLEEVKREIGDIKTKLNEPKPSSTESIDPWVKTKILALEVECKLIRYAITTIAPHGFDPPPPRDPYEIEAEDSPLDANQGGPISSKPN